jgi:hypothetical protein
MYHRHPAVSLFKFVGIDHQFLQRNADNFNDPSKPFFFGGGVLCNYSCL